MTTKTESTAKTQAKDKAKTGARAFDAFADLFKVPTLDAGSILEFQRRNIEAAAEANRLIFDGVKAVAQKNLDLAKENMAELNGAVTDVFSNKSPESNLSRTVECTQCIFQKNMDAAREQNDVLVNAAQKAVVVIQQRLQAGSETLQKTTK